MQHDLNLTSKKFEAFFNGVGTQLQPVQPVTVGCHIVVHECTKAGLTGRWVRLAVTAVAGATATVRTIARSTGRPVTRAA